MGSGAGGPSAGGRARGEAGAPVAEDDGPGAIEAGRAQRLARAVFAVLVVGCFAAFGVTQRLKHTPTPVQEFKLDVSFAPTRIPAAACRGRVPKRQVNSSRRVEYFAFKIAQADDVTVEIVDAANRGVATVVRDLPVQRYKPLSLCWNGQLGSGERGGPAPPGTYRVRVRLRSQDLTRYSTRSFELEGRR